MKHNWISGITGRNCFLSLKMVSTCLMMVVNESGLDNNTSFIPKSRTITTYPISTILARSCSPSSAKIGPSPSGYVFLGYFNVLDASRMGLRGAIRKEKIRSSPMIVVKLPYLPLCMYYLHFPLPVVHRIDYPGSHAKRSSK